MRRFLLKLRCNGGILFCCSLGIILSTLFNKVQKLIRHINRPVVLILDKGLIAPLLLGSCIGEGRAAK